jgi:hypothetical protein
MREKKQSERGKFYTAQTPENPASLTFEDSFIGAKHTVQTQFTEDELAHIRRAHEALEESPAILRANEQMSNFRPLTTYAKVPWGAALSKRKSALEGIEETYKTADIMLRHGIPYPEIAKSLRTANENLTPFLPPEEPPLRER